MIDWPVIVSLVGLSGSLVLAMSGMRSRNLSFEKGAAMAVAWVIIFGCLAYLIQRLSV